MPNKKICNKIHWCISVLAAFLAIPAFLISIFELGESKKANWLKMEPYVDIVGQNKPKPNEFHFLIKNLGEVDINNIYLECVILSRHGDDNKFREHIHVSTDLNGVLKAGKKKPIKIESDNSILPNKILIDPIGKVMVDPIVFIGLKIKYRRAIDSKLFENTFYYYTYPDPTETHFTSGPIKLENITAKVWWSAIKQIDKSFQFF